MSYRRFDRDFKLSAVKLAESSDLPLTQIARSLGIHDSMLRRWRSLVRSKGPSAFNESGQAERSEVVQLRRHNRRLKRELDALKKLCRYWSVTRSEVRRDRATFNNTSSTVAM